MQLFIGPCPTKSTFTYKTLGSRKNLRRKTRRVPVSELEGWHKARVISNIHESEGHRSICLEPPIRVLQQYTNPGMFVKLSNGKDKPNFFAVASAVNSPFLEFLVKKTHSTAWLCEMEKGGLVLMSSLMGKGFQLSRLSDVEHIYLLATGSGISPLKAVIESPQFQQLATKKDLQLYYGVRTPDRFSYLSRFSLWRQSGIRIHQICSTDASGRWTGRVGYVQHCLKQDGLANPKKSGALLCGVKGMIEEVTEWLQTQGVPSDKILTNF